MLFAKLSNHPLTYYSNSKPVIDLKRNNKKTAAKNITQKNKQIAHVKLHAITRSLSIGNN